MDAHNLFGYSTLAASASSAATAVTIADTAAFPDPGSVGAYNAVIWTFNQKPLASNAEVVRVTAKTGAVYTITRAQEGSTAKAFAAGDEIANAVTPKLFTDIETSVQGVTANKDVSLADTRLTWDWGLARNVLINMTPGGGTLSAIGTPTGGVGTRVTLIAYGNITLNHNTPGTGIELYMPHSQSLVLTAYDVAEFVFDGTFWSAVLLPVQPHDHTTADGSGVLTNSELDGFLDFLESAAPAAPAANHIRLYMVDDQGKHFMEFVDEDAVTTRVQRDVAVFMAKNTTGGTLAAGTPVYVNGISGSFPTIAKAKADSTTTMPCAGLLLTSAADNAFVKVLGMGRVNNIDTSAFANGDLLYVSADTAGIMTTVAPQPPNVTQFVGIVIKSHATTGIIFKIAGAVGPKPNFITPETAIILGGVG